MDVKPLKLEPTWRKKRGGPQAISKILDCFLIKDSLMNENLIIKLVVEIGGCSDHRPISLLISTLEKKPPAPFNSTLTTWKMINIESKLMLHGIWSKGARTAVRCNNLQTT